MRSGFVVVVLGALAAPSSSAFAAESFGPFRLDVPAGWSRAAGGGGGWEFAGPGGVRVWLAPSTADYRDERERKEILRRTMVATKAAHPDGWHEDRQRLAGVDAPRFRWREAAATVWEAYPFDAKRICRIRVTAPGADAAYPPAAERFLGTLALEGPAYQPPRRDLLSDLENLGRTLDRAVRDLDGLVGALTGQAPPPADPTSAPNPSPAPGSAPGPAPRPTDGSPPVLPPFAARTEPAELATAAQSLIAALRSGDRKALEAATTPDGWRRLRAALDGAPDRAKDLADALATRRLVAGDAAYAAYEVKAGGRTAPTTFVRGDDGRWRWEAK